MPPDVAKRYPPLLFLHPRGRPRPSDWSGTAYFLASALERLTTVAYFPLPEEYALRPKRFHPMRLWRRLHLLWAPTRSARVARRIARDVERTGFPKGTICFATHSTPIAYLSRRFKAAFFLDAVHDQFWQHYDLMRYFSSLDTWRDRRREPRCLRRADRIFYSSRWAGDEAARRLPVDERDKVEVVLIGANIMDPAGPPVSRAALPRLLWVGNDWQRKDGPLALRLLERLRARRPAARLTMVGTFPRGVPLPENCEHLGSIDKTDPRQLARMAELYAQHDFLLLPTRADCSSCVSAEAQLYGCLPVVTKVGGIPELIVNGVTGHVFDRDRYLEDGVQAILGLAGDPPLFQKMRNAAYLHAREHLRWEGIARRILESLQPLARAAARD